MKKESLDELFSLLSRRRLIIKKLIALDAPNEVIESENRLISKVLNEIEKRIDNIDKWNENFDYFFSRCENCIHFHNRKEDQVFCDKDDELPKITPHMKTTQCKLFSSK